jgi:sugar/nucleoside kinase (ribokinase family)
MVIEKTIDLFGFGIVAVDDLIEVPYFPPPGGKLEVISRHRQGGGLCATALVTAARLGLKCVYGGFLGRNELSEFTRETFRREGVGLVEDMTYPEAEPFHSFILVDRGTGERTIFYSRQKVVEPNPRNIRADLIAVSRALFVDHLGPEGTIQACKVARKLGIPIFADIESVNESAVREVINLTDHLIVSIRLALELTGCDDAESTVISLAQNRACTVVTDGSRGCWYVDAQDPHVKHLPAFKVDVVDTTGCGDVFHGAYAAALLSGMSIPESIRFAAAAAAIKATRPGGQLGIADRATVEQFLMDHSGKTGPR